MRRVLAQSFFGPNQRLYTNRQHPDRSPGHFVPAPQQGRLKGYLGGSIDCFEDYRHARRVWRERDAARASTGLEGHACGAQ